MGKGVFISVRLQFPPGELERWKKQYLADETIPLTNDLAQLVCQLDSELMNSELNFRTRVSSLLALLSRACDEGDLYTISGGHPGRGTFELTGYINGFDEFSVWFEPLVRLCTAASVHKGTGTAAFISDMEIENEMVFYWLSVSPDHVELTDFGAEGSPDPTDEQQATLPDNADLQQIFNPDPSQLALERSSKL